MNIYEELQWRGLVSDCTDAAELQKQLAVRPVTLYCGFDPTADSLHVGSLVPLLALQRFQEKGHYPIAVAGGATGSIGDPSGKTAERQLLTKEQISAMLKASQSVQSGWTIKDGSRVAGVHFYGPYFAEDKVGCHSKGGRRDPDPAEYREHLDLGIIRVATCAAELPGAELRREIDRAADQALRGFDHLGVGRGQVQNKGVLKKALQTRGLQQQEKQTAKTEHLFAGKKFEAWCKLK